MITAERTSLRKGRKPHQPGPMRFEDPFRATEWLNSCYLLAGVFAISGETPTTVTVTVGEDDAEVVSLCGPADEMAPIFELIESYEPKPAA